MTIALESMALAMPEVEGHPNRAAFRGVLAVVDAPSQRAPSGSKGRRVMLTKKAAEAALPSLLGMALDYAPSLDRHDARRKVGVITSAEVVGRNLEVGGYLYAKDFPEIVEEIAKASRTITGSSRTEFSRARQKALALHGVMEQRPRTEGARLRAALSTAVDRLRSLTMTIRGETKPVLMPILHAESRGGMGGALGMSYEVTDVTLADSRARVLTLTRVTFTGAAILRKEKAAYQDTWIELSG
jgi:hypothetical protein